MFTILPVFFKIFSFFKKITGFFKVFKFLTVFWFFPVKSYTHLLNPISIPTPTQRWALLWSPDLIELYQVRTSYKKSCISQSGLHRLPLPPTPLPPLPFALPIPSLPTTLPDLALQSQTCSQSVVSYLIHFNQIGSFDNYLFANFSRKYTLKVSTCLSNLFRTYWKLSRKFWQLWIIQIAFIIPK